VQRVEIQQLDWIVKVAIISALDVLNPLPVLITAASARALPRICTANIQFTRVLSRDEPRVFSLNYDRSSLSTGRAR